MLRFLVVDSKCNFLVNKATLASMYYSCGFAWLVKNNTSFEKEELLRLGQHGDLLYVVTWGFHAQTTELIITIVLVLTVEAKLKPRTWAPNRLKPVLLIINSLHWNIWASAKNQAPIMALLPANASQITDQNKLKGCSKATFLPNLFSVL